MTNHHEFMTDMAGQIYELFGDLYPERDELPPSIRYCFTTGANRLLHRMLSRLLREYSSRGETEQLLERWQENLPEFRDLLYTPVGPEEEYVRTVTREDVREALEDAWPEEIGDEIERDME